MYSVVGSCPDCGAPIWVPSTGWGSFPPAPIYSCPCHTRMHRIMVRTGFAAPIEPTTIEGFIERGEHAPQERPLPPQR